MPAAPPMTLAAARKTFAEPGPKRAGLSPAQWANLAVAGCVVLGVGLRIWALLRDPSLWGDEAMLALNVVHRPIGGLLEPLNLNQGAPVGYLVLVKLLTRAFGNVEWALRLPSLLAALVSIPLVARVAARELSPAGARWAIALFALAPHAVGYAGEFKQYGFDLGVCAGLLALGQAAWAAASRGSFVRLALGGAVAVWFSHPAAFVLAGVGAALCARPIGWTPRLLVGAAWGASFLTSFALFTRHLGANSYLNDYWSGMFWPLPPRLPGDLAWLVHHVIALFDNPAGFGTPGFGSEGLATLLAGLALLTLSKSRPALVCALVVPVGAALVASAFGKYPFGGRLMLYAVPLLMVAVGEGVALAAARLKSLHALAPWLLGGILVAPLLAESARIAQVGAHAEDVRGALEVAAGRAGPGDRFAAVPGALPATAYYAPRSGVDPAKLACATPDWAASVDQPTWVVVAHAPGEPVGELRAKLVARGRVAEVWAGAGARLWYCEPVAPAARPTLPAGDDYNGCPRGRVRVGSGIGKLPTDPATR